MKRPRPLDEPRDPAWGAAERALFCRYRDAARELVNPGMLGHDARGTFDREAFQRLGAMGLYELGAEGARGLPALLAALEGLSTGCDDAGFTVSIVAHAGVAIPVLAAMGDAEARRTLLPRLVSGEALGAVANAEPGGGTNVFGVRSRARPHEGGFLLSARKRSITNVGEAGILLVSARRTDVPAPRNLAAFALDARAPGCHQRPGKARMGLCTSPTGDLVARNVELPRSALLGDGVELFRRCFALERLAVGALHVGTLRRALRRALDHLERRPALGAHQYVQQRVVALRTSLAFTEALLFRVRLQALAGEACEAELSVLKGQGAEWAAAAAGDVVRLLGARGYEVAAGAEKDARDMVGLTLLGGTAELHKGVVFSATVKRDAQEAG